MHLAFVATTLLASRNGGIPAFNRQVVRQLARLSRERGVELDVSVWSLHDRSSSAEARRELGLADRRWHGFAGSKSRMVLEAAWTRERPDLVFCSHVGVAPVARLLSRGGAPLFQFLHGVECWRPLSPRVRWGIRHTAGFLSNSSFTHSKFVEHNPEHAAVRHCVTWLGVPEEHIAPPTRTPPDAGPPSVLIVARMVGAERYKGHEQLIQIWPRVLERVPRATLDIVGTGTGTAALLALAEKLDLVRRGAVKFWGELPDDELAERYRRCRVFAMPSRGEGFGLVYLEAMSFGKACIASTDDAAHEVVSDAESGMLVPYASKNALFEAVTLLLQDETVCAALGRGGRARLEAHFTERLFGERLWGALGLGGARA